MRFCLALSVMLLAACDSPSPWMQGGTRHEVLLEGYRFTIWHQGNAVEIIRHGYAARADQPRLRPLMAQAARQATGCSLRPGSVEGDTGVLRAHIDCDTSAQSPELAQDQGA